MSDCRRSNSGQAQTLRKAKRKRNAGTQINEQRLMATAINGELASS